MRSEKICGVGDFQNNPVAGDVDFYEQEADRESRSHSGAVFRICMELAEKLEGPKRVIARVVPYAWLALLAYAVWMLSKEWGGFHLADLNAALERIGPWRLVAALALTAASLLCNASLDLVALRVLGGGAIRLRFYGQQGLGAADVAQITGFLLVAGWLGHALLAGVMLCWQPPELAWLSVAAGRGLGVALLASCAAICVLSAKEYSGRWMRFVPPWRVLLVAMAVSGLDWLFAGLALRVFLPEGISTPAFLAATAVGQALGAASHVPGGIGVMELFITKFTRGMVAGPVIAGALLTYRLTYYLIPFMLAVAFTGGREIWMRRHWAKRTVDGTGKAWSAIAPRLAGMTALAGGFVLMLSATTPMDAGRKMVLERFVPLPFVEASHFLSSIAGTVMIVVASGLLRRVRTAWWIAVLMAGGGIVFSLLKGFDWEESLVLLVFLGALLPFREKFHRHAAIWTRRFSLHWWGLILSIVGLALWFGFFTSRHVGYENTLWWSYSFDDDASRLLRGMAGSLAILLTVALIQWFRPAPPRKKSPAPPMEKIEEMVFRTARCASALALVGDKEFLFNSDRSAFLMYGDQGRTRVAMADPVGDEARFEGLYWRFMEQAQDDGMRVAFYQVGAAMMPVCVEMGLRIYKLGEEAMVPLETFDLASSELKKFRKVMNRMEREMWVFEIWQPATVAARIGELKAVSDAWLSHHKAREKGFSLGRFTDSYVKRLPMAVILVDGKLTAFGNLWPGNGRDELSTDLMRHLPDAPNGVMDCLFVSMMLWGREQGYRWFDLGMAPLSGLTSNPFAPLWSRIGGVIYDKGEAFYNFNGLRAWKSKFQPVWLPRYLAISKAWDLPTAILDITTLIGRTSSRRQAVEPTAAQEVLPEAEFIHPEPS